MKARDRVNLPLRRTPVSVVARGGLLGLAFVFDIKEHPAPHLDAPSPNRAPECRSLPSNIASPLVASMGLASGDRPNLLLTSGRQLFIQQVGTNGRLCIS